ncbi:MAG: ABC transporter ATP-binding protein [Candidatus Saccharibacteria bacterium]
MKDDITKKYDNVVDDDNIIVADQIFKHFMTSSGTVNVLHDVKFSIKKGSFTTIFGPSGGGKSTLMNVMAGLEPPTIGSMRVANQDIYRLNSDQRAHFRSKNISIVHQSNHWVKSLSVIENVALPLYLSGSKKGSALAVARQSLEQVGMSEYVNSRPTVLSGGQQQLVSMARALVTGTDLIFADEPTGNLDTKSGNMVIDLLLKFQKDFGRTIILVTHNLGYLSLGDKQLYMVDGGLTESTPGKMLPSDTRDAIKHQIKMLIDMEKGLKL